MRLSVSGLDFSDSVDDVINLLSHYEWVEKLFDKIENVGPLEGSLDTYVKGNFIDVDRLLSDNFLKDADERMLILTSRKLTSEVCTKYLKGIADTGTGVCVSSFESYETEKNSNESPELLNLLYGKMKNGLTAGKDPATDRRFYDSVLKLEFLSCVTTSYHELLHTFGLDHCKIKSCVMYQDENLHSYTTQKLCKTHEKKMEKNLRNFVA